MNSSPNVEKAEKWDKVIGQILLKPSTKAQCPFCHGTSVLGSWRLAKGPKVGSRTAIFDAWCDLCGEKVHAFVKLPAESPDEYSVRKK